MKALFAIVLCALAAQSKAEESKALYELVLAPVPKLNLTRAAYYATLTVGPEKIEGVIGERHVYTAFCSSWISGGCDDSSAKTENLPPTLTELRDWYKNRICRYGRICGEGECEGSDAKAICENTSLQDRNSTVEPRGRRLYQHYNKYNPAWFVDTCIKDYNCSTMIHPFIVQLVTKGDSVTAQTMNSNGGMLPLDLSEPENMFKVGYDNQQRLAFFQTTPLKTHKVNVNCYIREKATPVCQLPHIPDYPELKDQLIKLNQGNGTIGAARNFHLRLHDRVKEVPDDSNSLVNKLFADYLLDKTSNSRGKRDIREYMKRFKDTSQVNTIAHGLMYLAEESTYNDITLVKVLHNLQSVVLKLLKSKSYTDPDLLAKVLSADGTQLSFTTNWVSESFFAIYKPGNGTMLPDPYSHCNRRNNTVFKDGKYVPLDGETCREVTTDVHVEKFSPFSDYPIVTSNLRSQAYSPGNPSVEKRPAVRMNAYLNDNAEEPWLEPKPKKEASKEFNEILEEYAYVVVWSLFLVRVYQLFQKMSIFHFFCLLILLPIGAGVYFFTQTSAGKGVIGVIDIASSLIKS